MALITIWGDESSQNGHKYMVLGTIWQHPSCAADLERDVQNLKRATNFHKEFHWTDLKGHQIKAYKGLIEIFKEYMDQGLLKFRALVVDQSDPIHKEFSENDDELHFYKMFFWLIYKRLREEHRYDIFLDQKNNSVPGRLSDLKNSLNNKFDKEYYAKKGRVFLEHIVRRVEARDGSQVELQIADVFAGAIAYVRNGYYSTSKNQNNNNPKVQLVEHIQNTLNISLDSCHKRTESDGFNIWCFERK